MQRLLTSLETSYQPALTAPWALREIVSNAYDGQTRSVDHTGDARIDYDEDAQVLTVANHATIVPAKALLMGTSESRDREDTIGTFGEGLPMALLVLARAGHHVEIDNGDERWVPEIVESEEYKAQVLAIQRERLEQTQGFTVRVHGIDPDCWLTVQGWFLRLDSRFDPKQTAVASASGTERVLLQPEFAGRVYNKGVFVMHSNDLRFGYDMDTALNRDRSLVDTITLQHQTSALLSGAFQYGGSYIEGLVEDMLFSGSSNTELRTDWCDHHWTDEARDRFSDTFREMYGPTAIPVDNMHESQQAEHLGRRGVVVAPLLRELVGDRIGTLSEVTNNARMTVAKIYAWHDLTTGERRTLMASQRAVQQVLSDWSPNVRVVDFATDDIMGRYHNGQIDLARRILADPADTLVTLVHEVCHCVGGDGSHAHGEAQVEVLGAICINLGLVGD